MNEKENIIMINENLIQYILVRVNLAYSVERYELNLSDIYWIIRIMFIRRLQVNENEWVFYDVYKIYKELDKGETNILYKNFYELNEMYKKDFVNCLLVYFKKK